MSHSKRHEHPGSVGKSKTAGPKLQFSHARSKLKVATCGKQGQEGYDYVELQKETR